MPAPADLPVEIPGAPSEPQATPGALIGGADSVGDASAAEIAALQAQVAALQGQLAAASQAPSESIVVTPVTPHGRQALAASAFAAMTTKEVDAKVKAGEIDLGTQPSVLCADGYFCNPAYR